MNCFGRNRNNDGSAEHFDLNTALEKIGYFGKFHWCQLVLLIIIGLSGGIGTTSYAFTAYVPNYRCLVPQCEDIQTATYYHHAVTSNDDWTQDELTFADFVRAADNLEKHSCKRKTVKDPQISCNAFLSILRSSNATNNIIEETCPIDQVVYDKSVVDSSLATRFEFACGRFALRGIFNSFMMVGMLIGSFPVGMFSDRFGRKLALAACIVIQPLVGLIGAFNTWLPLLAICRIFLGMAIMGTHICSFVLLAESTLPTFTNTAVTILKMVWPLGQLIVVLAAYNIRCEFTLQLVLYTPLFLNLFPLLFVKESTRWLLAKDKFHQAQENVKVIAKMNGKPMPELTDVVHEEEKGRHAKESFLDLFREKKMFFRTLNCFFQWFSITALTYTLIFASTTLMGSPYMNFTIVTVVMIPGKLVGIYIFDRLGRRWSLVMLQACTGICCMLVGVAQSSPHLPGYLQPILNACGTFFSEMCFGLVYLYCAELFPTTLRGTATGACSSFGRLGGIYALSIEGLKSYWTPLPLLLVGGQAMLASVLAIAFPETTGAKLPETIEEAVNDIGKDFKLKPWCPSRQIEPLKEDS